MQSRVAGSQEGPGPGTCVSPGSGGCCQTRNNPRLGSFRIFRLIHRRAFPYHLKLTDGDWLMACRLTRSFVNSLTGKILSTLLELFIAWLPGGRALLAAVLAPSDPRASSERSSFRINELTSSRVNREQSQSDETGHSELS